MPKILKIVDSKKTQGLKLFCASCRSEVGTTNVCIETKKSLRTCPNSHHHAFRVVVYEPNSYKRRVKVLKTKDIDVAIKEAVQFREEVKSGKYQNNEIKNEIIKPEEKAPLTLIESMTYYISHLSGERGPAHTLHVRSTHHRNDVQNNMVMFAQVIKQNGVDPAKLSVYDITQNMIGYFHDYLWNTKKYKPKTYNRCINNVSGLFTYLNKFEGQNIRNPFDTVIRKRPIQKEPTFIEPHELQALLKIIKVESGKQILKSGNTKQRYFPFISIGIKLAYLCGLRREALVSLRYNSIKEDAEGRPILITSKNIKVNKILHIEDSENQHTITTPVTPQLRRVLEEELNYSQNRGSDKFLIESNLKRENIVDILSKSFSHYWAQLGLEKKAEFADLRKSFINKMQLAMGDNARLVTGHQSNAVMDKHYLNKELFLKIASNKDIFPELDFSDEKKIEEINSIRTQQKNNNISIER